MHQTNNDIKAMLQSASGIFPVLPIGAKPLIMGVLNITPDSFSDGGRFFNPEKAVEHGLSMADQGADIIDVGGESTRPGAEAIDTDEEIERIVPAIERLKKKIAIPISIDTRRAEVAELACQAGASVINDISGLNYDERIAEVAHKYDAYLILMHMKGTPETMQKDIHYDDLIGEISSFLKNAAAKAMSHGVDKAKIIIDPGIGFGKTVEHNFSIIKNIHGFVRLGYPVMIGASRKSFIGKSLDLPVEQRLEGSLAAAIMAVLKGAAIVRVHDVLATARALKIVDKINEAE